jgi:tRNA-uridine 2-sulfurtransferase
VRVGPAEELDVTELTASDPVWLVEPPVGPLACAVQVRAHGGLVAATVRVGDDGVDVVLEQPLRGVAPGQAAVFYRPDAGGDVVLGSATIAATSR